MKTILGMMATIALIFCSCDQTPQQQKDKPSEALKDTLSVEPLKSDTFDRNKSEMESMDSIINNL